MSSNLDYFLNHLLCPGISYDLLIFTLISAVGLSIFAWCIGKKDKFKNVLIVWIAAYLFIILYVAVIGRTAKNSISVQLIPFWSIQAIQNGYIETIYEKVYNVIFFVPYGVLWGAYPHPLPEEAYPQPLPKGKGGWKKPLSDYLRFTIKRCF